MKPEDFTLELTRGNVKAAMAQAGASSADVWRVPPDMIRIIPGFNPRQDTAEYREHRANIKNSIIANGFYLDEPLGGFVGEVDGVDVIFLTSGHTRYGGVLDAIAEGTDIKTVPMVIKPKGTSMKDLTKSLVISNSGKGFTPYETGLVIKRLVGYGDTSAQIAADLTLSVGYVNDLLDLVAAPKAVTDLVVHGKASATLAIEELAKHGAKAGERLQSGLKKAEAEGKSRVTGKHLEKPPKVDMKGLLREAIAALSHLDVDDAYAALVGRLRTALG